MTTDPIVTPKPPKPPKPPRVRTQLNLLVDPELFSTLGRIAEATGRRRGEVAILILRDGIKRQLEALPVAL